MGTDNQEQMNKWIPVIIPTILVAVSYGVLQSQVNENTDHRKNENLHRTEKEVRLLVTEQTQRILDSIIDLKGNQLELKGNQNNMQNILNSISADLEVLKKR